MKTSNIIILAFAIFIIGGMLFLFADAKKHKADAKNNIVFKEFTLPTFSVVVAEGADLHIDWSDSTLLKVEYIKDIIDPSKIYEVVNDTLHIYGGQRTFVKCKDIIAIIGNNSAWVGVYNFAPDSLTIRMNGGRLYYNLIGTDKIVEYNQKVFNLGIIANDNAHIEIANARLGNLSIKSNNSIITNHCDVKHLHANLTNFTKFFNFNKIESIIVERDTTSYLEIGNQSSFQN